MPRHFPADPTEFCVTDVGSTTTKAILFRRTDGGWRFFRSEAPTTVEKPHEDVAVGVRHALRALGKETGVTLLKDGRPAVPYLTTSSAGGGLAMVVTGLVREVTSRSAERVALGAGAILLDVVAMNDGRTPYEKVEVLKTLRPDMILLAGGFDGEAISGPVYLAELILEARLRPKLSKSATLPVLYAGNVNACDLVNETLGEGFGFHSVPNIRPTANRENLEPAREEIHELFMNHVMSQAPGYEGLISWIDAPVLPTPAAFGKILAAASRRLKKRILAIDIGGATTDVFTAHKGEVARTVSANLGMSYSILNVAESGGIDSIRSSLGIEMTDADLWNSIGNKYLKPTRLPRNPTEMRVEWAAAVIAIREAVKDHLSVLKGTKISRGKEDLAIRNRFLRSRARRRQVEETGFELTGYDMVIGSGGILSHSPRDAAARMMTRALAPQNEMDLAVDSAFMFPHLGVLSEVQPDLALDLFFELGLVRLEPSDPSSAISAESDLIVPVRETEIPDRERIKDGPIILLRELAIPGEVFVKPGDLVEPETLVARSSRQFLRPFFLDLRYTLKCDPADVPGCMLKKVGDEIAKDEVVARRKTTLVLTREYRSTVSGTLERILPSGTIVVREKPEEAIELTAVNIAKELSLRPDQIKPYLRVEVGQQVESGQALASIMRPGSIRSSKSPVRGKIKEINEAYGIVMIAPLLEKLEIKAWMPGRVEKVGDRGCVVENSGIELTGNWGMGGEVHGLLATTDPGPGLILVKESADRTALEELEKRGVEGLIVGGLDLKDARELELSYTIVMIGEFGDKEIDQQARDVLQSRTGKLALLDGTTELRVGVRRPMILLPNEVNQGHRVGG